MENKHMPAHPVVHQNDDGSLQYDVYKGLTKREKFAESAMAAILSNPTESDVSAKTVLQVLGIENESYDFKKHYPSYIAKLAIAYADELLNQLSK